jgi:hypothetical protein
LTNLRIRVRIRSWFKVMLGFTVRLRVGVRVMVLINETKIHFVFIAYLKIYRIRSLTWLNTVILVPPEPSLIKSLLLRIFII